MPDRDVARVEPASLEGCRRRLCVIIVALHHTVAVHYHLSHCLPIPRHVVHILINDAYMVSGHPALTLPGQQSCLLLSGEVVPLLMPFTDSTGTIGFG